MQPLELEEGLEQPSSRRHRICGDVTPLHGAFVLLGVFGMALVSGWFSSDASSDAEVIVGNVQQFAEAHHLVGGRDQDRHHCYGSAGFVWCDSVQDCVRPWSNSCPGGTKQCQEHCCGLAGFGWCKKTNTCMRPGEEGSCEPEPFQAPDFGVTCSCHDGRALDYKPDQCTDLHRYHLEKELGGCKDGHVAYGVVHGSCTKLPGCSEKQNHLGIFASSEECEKECGKKTAL